MDRERIAGAIVAAATARGPERSLCPAEIARALDPARWRALMPAVREAAAALAAAGAIRVTRRGVEVDARAAGGPIRLSAPPRRPGRDADRA